MNRGFYTIMAAQVFSSLADNALLIAAIALLSELAAPAWMTPLLRLCFTLSYIIFAAYVGIFADSMPKGRVMFLTNTLKAVGCLFMLFGGHPLLAYAIVGLGAAAYSPAKYGILTELLPPDKLVVANGWIEGLTVISIILGVVLGGALILPAVADPVLAAGVLQTIGIHTRAGAAISIVFFIYLIAAACNLFIPDTGVRYPKADFEPIKTVCNFLGSCKALWTDKLGQTSLAVTSMFWGAGAVLQFLVLSWADTNFGLNLSQASILQAVVSVGIAIGAVGAATFVPLKKCLKVLPMGVLMGVVVVFAAHFNRAMAPSVITLPGGFEISWAIIIAGCIMVLVGALAGFFVVPMNALLQNRGFVLMSAGRSIAVQNFNENSSMLIMLGIYSLMIKGGLTSTRIMEIFGAFVAIGMIIVILTHRRNAIGQDLSSMIGEESPHLQNGKEK